MSITEQIQAAQDAMNAACDTATGLIKLNQDGMNAQLDAMKAQLQKVSVDFPAAVGAAVKAA